MRKKYKIFTIVTNSEDFSYGKKARVDVATTLEAAQEISQRLLDEFVGGDETGFEIEKSEKLYTAQSSIDFAEFASKIEVHEVEL